MSSIRASESLSINNVQFANQDTPPTTPASDFHRLYFTSTGLKWVNESGDVNAALEVQDLTISQTSGNTSLRIIGAAGSLREIALQTGAATRWKITANNATESGGGAGSNLTFARFDDDGAYVGDALEIIRSSGHARFAGDLEVDATLDHDGNLIGVYGANPVSRPTITGSRGGNVALQNLLNALQSIGWIVNSTT